MPEKEKDEKTAFATTAWDLQDTYEGISSTIPAKFGLCSECASFVYAVYKYGKEKYLCIYDDKMMNWPCDDGIVDCSKFSRRGMLSLQEMNNIATYINNNKKSIGFIEE